MGKKPDLSSPGLLVINGTLGCGKTTIAKALQAQIHGAMVLHGDEVSARVINFSVKSESSLLTVIQRLAEQASARIAQGCPLVIIDYVFETPGQLNALFAGVAPHVQIGAFYLSAQLNEIDRRIRIRQHADPEAEMSRTREILATQAPHVTEGGIGQLLDTGTLDVKEILTLILAEMGSAGRARLTLPPDAHAVESN